MGYVDIIGLQDLRNARIVTVVVGLEMVCVSLDSVGRYVFHLIIVKNTFKVFVVFG